MPAYQFRCDDGHVTDVYRRPDDASRDARCDECGKPAKRLYRIRGIGFKGSGFHNTDYPKPSARAERPSSEEKQ